jgi:hypothetical protein
MPRTAHRVVLIEPVSIAGIERRRERSSFEAFLLAGFLLA